MNFGNLARIEKFDNSAWVEKIEQEIERLGLSADSDPCSGLTLEPVEVCEAVVALFDDHARGGYYADQLLALLEGLSPEEVSLDSDSEKNVWGLIRKVEV